MKKAVCLSGMPMHVHRECIGAPTGGLEWPWLEAALDEPAPLLTNGAAGSCLVMQAALIGLKDGCQAAHGRRDSVACRQLARLLGLGLCWLWICSILHKQKCQA